MTSVVTLHMTACAGGANLAGAAVTDGFNTVYTNAYGEVLIYFDDPIGYGVNVSKPGYVSRGVAVYATQNGTTQTFCLDAAPPPSSGGGGGGGGISCFIVSAATGSPESEDVVALRALRDQVMTRSAVAGALVDAVYQEYWQFSPAVAEKLDADKFARQGALMAAVRPLVAWYQLAGQLAFDHRDAAAVEKAIRALRDACPRWMSPSSVAGLISTLRSGEAIPAGAPQTLRDLAPQLQRAASLPLVDWAILRPLQMCWTIAAERLDPVAEIGQWLGGAPVERVESLPNADVESHSRALGGLLAFHPQEQARLLDRLHAELAKRSAAPAQAKRKPSGCGC